MLEGHLYGHGGNVLDYQGEKDDRTWIMREKVLEDAVTELTAERDFLRRMLSAALEHNTERKP